MCFHYIPYSNCLKKEIIHFVIQVRGGEVWVAVKMILLDLIWVLFFPITASCSHHSQQSVQLLHICRKVVMYYYDVLGLFRLYIWWLFLKGRNRKQIYFVLSEWCTAPTVCESLIYHKIWKRLQWQHDWCWINASSAALVLYSNRQTLFAAKNQSLIHYQWSGFRLYITTF